MFYTAKANHTNYVENLLHKSKRITNLKSFKLFFESSECFAVAVLKLN